MFKYTPRPAIHVPLRLLDYAIRNDTHEEVLDVLGRGIKAACARIDRAAASDRDEYADAVTDTEIEIIEGLLGAAYVVCQAQVTAITQTALRCRAQVLRDGLAFPAFGEPDHEVRRLGPSFNSQWSKIEVLWALANYFKHRDEWSSDTWTNPQRLEQHTVPVILAAGLQPVSNGNLRTGAGALGNPDYADMKVFHDIIREWGDQLRSAIRLAAGV